MFKYILILVAIIFFSSCVVSPWKMYNFTHLDNGDYYLKPSKKNDIPDKKINSKYYIGDAFVDLFIDYDKSKTLNVLFIAYSYTDITSIEITKMTIMNEDENVILLLNEEDLSKKLDLEFEDSNFNYNWGGSKYSFSKKLKFKDNEIIIISIKGLYNHEGEVIEGTIKYKLKTNKDTGLLEGTISA